MKCKISSPGCVYHACMSADCQKRFMLEGLTKNFYGKPDCEIKITMARKKSHSKIRNCNMCLFDKFPEECKKVHAAYKKSQQKTEPKQ
jgi:hypothetical protein